MIKYECGYCGDLLCPEECVEAESKQQEWVNSEDYKTLISEVELPVL